MNRTSATNNLLDLDYALVFYSKYHVYLKSDRVLNRCCVNNLPENEEGNSKISKEENSTGSNFQQELEAEVKKKKSRKSEEQIKLQLINSFNAQRVDKAGLTYSNHGNVLLEDSFCNIDNPELNTNEKPEENNSVLDYKAVNTEYDFDKFEEFQREVLNLPDYSKNKNDDIAIENLNVDTFEKLEKFIETKTKSIKIEKENICKHISFT